MADAQDERLRMIDVQLRARGLRHAAVLAAMASVPRHRFVPPDQRDQAYADCALPNAQGQTISQPYIVALMSALLDVTASARRVLEIGTGSGYQTAILVALEAEVVTVERHGQLLEAAQRNLTESGYGHAVSFNMGDGTLGWAQGAPYDRILVTAAAARLPDALRRQLADGGKIVMPLGGRHGAQALYVIERRGTRWLKTRSTDCLFVPLIGKQGWQD